MQPHERVLADLGARGRLRSLAQIRGRDFTSNDYLALAESEALRRAVAEALERGVPVGAGGSRLLRGNHPEHEALEEEAARFFGHEATLYFPTGFAANAAIAATLPRRDDLIVFDALMHASFRDGLEPQRIETAMAPHNDVDAIADAITAWRGRGGRGRPWIAAETLYGMDGDRAPLADLVALAARLDAMLVLDEAHATGVHGPQGRGLAASHEGQPNIVTLHTCGKALGTAGALVCLPRRFARFHDQSRPRLHLLHRAIAADGRDRARGVENLRRRRRGTGAAACAGGAYERVDARETGNDAQRQPGAAHHRGRRSQGRASGRGASGQGP